MRHRLKLRQILSEKWKEALQAVLPIITIVLALSFTIAPLSPSVLLCFLMGAVLILVGMMFFTTGAETAMTPMGERIGTAMTKTKKLGVVITLSFLLGFIITVSEPDLQVLASQVPSVPNLILILSVACGVGVFLVVSLLRMLFSIALPPLLVGCYAVVFLLAFFVPPEFLGVGISAIRSDRHAADDSFGLVALSSIGPILAVMILGIIYNPNESTYTPPILPEMQDSSELFELFRTGIPTYLIEIAVSLLPIILFFLAAQFLVLRLSKRKLFQIGMGLVYTYIGLVLFLTGANVGFMPAGHYLGQQLASYKYSAVVIPVAMVMGYFIVRAEPAVYVLNRQVEEITDGAISAKAMGIGLSVGVSISLGLAMIRVLTGISILWFLIPGYALALIISFFVPKIYTAIAFDSGGVASGPMTAAFLLPLAQGACTAVGGNMVTDAFGVVAMVAMTPLITIQVMGLAAKLMQRRKTETAAPAAFADMDENAIIEL